MRLKVIVRNGDHPVFQDQNQPQLVAMLTTPPAQPLDPFDD